MGLPENRVRDLCRDVYVHTIYIYIYINIFTYVHVEIVGIWALIAIIPTLSAIIPTNISKSNTMSIFQGSSSMRVGYEA